MAVFVHLILRRFAGASRTTQPSYRGIQQARVNHGLPDHFSGRGGDGQQRQADLLLAAAEQLQPVLGTGKAGLASCSKRSNARGSAMAVSEAMFMSRVMAV